MIQSFLLLVAAIFGLFLPVLAQHKADTQHKTEKPCAAEWRANTAAGRTKGTTQDAFVKQCQGGGASAQAAASSAAPSTNGVATPLQKPSRAAAHVEKRRVTERNSRSHTRRRAESPATPLTRAESDRKSSTES